jgi:hypothetical protein
MQPPANKVFFSSLSIEDMEATARHAGLVHRYPSRLSTAPPSSTLRRQQAQQDDTIQDIIRWSKMTCAASLLGRTQGASAGRAWLTHDPDTAQGIPPKCHQLTCIERLVASLQLSDSADTTCFCTPAPFSQFPCFPNCTKAALGELAGSAITWYWLHSAANKASRGDMVGLIMLIDIYCPEPFCRGVSSNMLSAPFHGISRRPCLLGRNSWWTQVPLPGSRGWPVWLKALPSLSFAFPEHHQPHPYDSFCFPPSTKPFASLPSRHRKMCCFCHRVGQFLFLSPAEVDDSSSRGGCHSPRANIPRGCSAERWQN